MERVTFSNPESGFAVLRVQVSGERDPVTVLGSLPSVSAGEWLTAGGWWVRDKEPGLLFKAKILKTIPPTTSGGDYPAALAANSETVGTLLSSHRS